MKKEFTDKAQRMFDYMIEFDNSLLRASYIVTDPEERENIFKHNVAFMCACFVTTELERPKKTKNKKNHE